MRFSSAVIQEYDFFKVQSLGKHTIISGKPIKQRFPAHESSGIRNFQHYEIFRICLGIFMIQEQRA